MTERPYRIRMKCGYLEVRLIQPRIAGRTYSPQLIIEAGIAQCAECDPAKSDLRSRQRELNQRYLKPDEMRLAAPPSIG